MKLPRFSLVFLIVFFISPVSALQLSSFAVDPVGPLTPGTPVTLNFEIDTTHFLTRDDLQFFTDLDNDTWTYTITKGGVESLRSSQEGRVFTIPGSDLGSVGPESPYEQLPDPSANIRGTLTGTVPEVQHATTKILFRVQILDSWSRCITNPLIERTVLVNAPVMATFPSQKTVPVIITPVTPIPENAGNLSQGTRTMNTVPITSGNHLSEEQKGKPAAQNHSLDEILRKFRDFLGMRSQIIA